MDKDVARVINRRRFLEVASTSAVAALLAACTNGPAPTVTPIVMATPTMPATMATPAANGSAATPSAAPAMSGMAGSAGGTRTATGGSATSAPRPGGSAVAANTATTGSATTATGASAASAAARATPSGAGSAVAGSTTAGMQTNGLALAIRAVDYGFQTVGSIQAGLVTIMLQNLGKEPHQAQFVRLNDGVTVDQFLAALKSDLQNNGNTADDLATLEGGPNAVVGGAGNEVIQDLKVGQYVILCFVPNAMGVPHAALGMVLPLMVTGPARPATTIPMVNGTITLANDNFDLPTLPTGRSLFRVVNNGTQPADFQLLGIAPGKTVDDVQQFLVGLSSGSMDMMMATGSATPMATMGSATPSPMTGPIPVTGGAGIASLSPGGSGIAVFNLTAGDYVAWTGDPSTGIAKITVA